MPGLRIHIYVQHLLGGGHLVRMKRVAAALAGAGHHVTLISGGMAGGRPDAAYRLLQLPAVKTAPGDFGVLLDSGGAPVGDDFKARRAAQLLQWVVSGAPQALLVESFPFGRRALRFELVPLMEAVAAMKPRPLTLCSVRDILQTRSAERDRRTVAEVNAWFDHLLVHADPAVVNLAETFPLAGQLHGKVFYTHYVYGAAAQPGAAAPDRGSVVVSAGGGAVGFKLLRTAILARPLSGLKDRAWHLLVGRNASAAEFHALAAQAEAGRGITVQWSRPDFAGMLAACAVSVSQAGYNTVLDTVAANCRAVLVPYSRHGETEQQRRAEKFAEQGRAVVVREQHLDPARLAEAVDRAARLDLSGCRPLRMDGAAQTVDFIERQLLQRATP